MDPAITDTTRVWLRPCHWIDSPQQQEGAAPLRLAGTMLWFGAVELIARGPGGIARTLVPTAGIEGRIAAMPEGPRLRAEAALARLTAPRAPLQLGGRTVRLDQPQVMAILNRTPDSFSDGGLHNDEAAAIAAGFAMAGAGAAIVDVGGESTRPGAETVWDGDEIARVEPLVKALAAGGVAVSIDTRKAAVMEAALAAGATLINDVAALRHEPRTADVARDSSATVAIMHAGDDPKDLHATPGHGDVLTEVYDWLEARIEALETVGIDRARILVDPGIGFAKSVNDNLALVNGLALFHGLGCPILFGASRKRMIGALSGEAEAKDRLGGSIALAMLAVGQGAHIVRVHDVAETVQALRVWRGARDAALTARA